MKRLAPRVSPCQQGHQPIETDPDGLLPDNDDDNYDNEDDDDDIDKYKDALASW